MSASPILLIGGGGHCRSVIDVLETAALPIAGIVDARAEGGDVCGWPVLGGDDDLPELRKRFDSALITVGQIKSAAIRRRLFALLQSYEFNLPWIVSPRALVARTAELGAGTVVMHDAIVNSCARIGSNCIINTKALIEHDVVVGDDCHVSTGVILNGGVAVGPGSFVGSGAVVREGVRIGAGGVIGMGVVVRRDVPDNTIFVG